MPEPLATIEVEVVYAAPQKQILRKVEIPSAATVEEAIRASGILAELPAGFVPAGLGIFGQRVAADSRLRAGDRVELYRPLAMDPKEARRQRVKKKLQR
jgi:putative ubiquitin-RnfH superfamily antitoxin RatB of RatAB toxin-antitoxin module